jgi:hypothetical protein
LNNTTRTSDKLLAIAIAIAIIAAVATTSLSIAKPAFAKRNCNPDITLCTGGFGSSTGGGGNRYTQSDDTFTRSGGGSLCSGNPCTVYGGKGGHETCDTSGCDLKGGGVNTENRPD